MPYRPFKHRLANVEVACKPVTMSNVLQSKLVLVNDRINSLDLLLVIVCFDKRGMKTRGKIPLHVQKNYKPILCY